MCIRDRFIGGVGQVRRRRRGVAAGHVPVFDDAGVLATVGPVSYTHLRAHETVLDLVCRLLLEKKNTHTHVVHTTILAKLT